MINQVIKFLENHAIITVFTWCGEFIRTTRLENGNHFGNKLFFWDFCSIRKKPQYAKIIKSCRNEMIFEYWSHLIAWMMKNRRSTETNFQKTNNNNAITIKKGKIDVLRDLKPEFSVSIKVTSHAISLVKMSPKSPLFKGHMKRKFFSS